MQLIKVNVFWDLYGFNIALHRKSQVLGRHADFKKLDFLLFLLLFSAVFTEKEDKQHFKNTFFRLTRLLVFDINGDPDIVKGFYPVKDKEPYYGISSNPIAANIR